MNDDGVIGRIHEVGIWMGGVFSVPSLREQCQIQGVEQGPSF